MEPVDLPPDDEIVDLTNADVVTDEPHRRQTRSASMDGPFRRPGFWVSLLWTFLLMVSQIAITLGILVLVAVFLLLTEPFNANAFPNRLQSVAMYWLLPAASLSTVLFAVGTVAIAFRGDAFRYMGLRRTTAIQTVLVLLLAIPMGVLSSEFTNWMTYPANYLFPDFPGLDHFEDFVKNNWLLVFVAGCLFPGLGEELFFRGFLGRGLLTRYGLIGGTLLTAFMFGAVHVHPVQASGAFLLGLVLHFVFLTTRSLWGAILLHTANNLLAFTLMRFGSLFPISGLTYAPQDSVAHTPIALVFVAFAAVAVLLFALYQTRTQWRREDGSLWSHADDSSELPLEDPSLSLETGQLNGWMIPGVALSYLLFSMTLVWCIES